MPPKKQNGKAPGNALLRGASLGSVEAMEQWYAAALQSGRPEGFTVAPPKRKRQRAESTSSSDSSEQESDDSNDQTSVKDEAVDASGSDPSMTSSSDAGVP
jgi:hypothetical protein